MSDTATKRRTWLPWAIAGGIVALALLAWATVGLTNIAFIGRGAPDFVSLALVPDPTLSGTVAYFDDETHCVRVVAAAGQPNVEAYCVEDQSPSQAEKEGKDVGVDIAWLPDNRLQLTLYRMTNPGPDVVFTPAWRRIVNVVTGDVQEVPVSSIPTTTPQAPCLTESPEGDRVITSSEDGHAVVTLATANGERTLLDVHGDPETYRISQACWAPNFQWIFTSDTRLLIITPGDPSVTRTLTPPMTTFYGYDALSWYAVTSANVLSGVKSSP